MILKILPYALQGFAVIGGVGAGLWLKSASPPAAEAEVMAHEERAHQPSDVKAKAAKNEKKEKHKPAKKKSSHGGGHGDASADDNSEYGYVKFSRQFIIPVLDHSKVSALIVMDINIEAPPSATESIYAREPKLRDAILSTLLKLSNKGAFANRLLEQENLDDIRAELLASARAVVGEEAQSVLILNITRQDV